MNQRGGGSRGWLPTRRCEKMKLCSTGIKLTGSRGNHCHLPPICPSYQTPPGTRAETQICNSRLEPHHISGPTEERLGVEVGLHGNRCGARDRQRTREARGRSRADWGQAGVWLTGVRVGRGHRTQTLKQMRVVASESRTCCSRAANKSARRGKLAVSPHYPRAQSRLW